MEGVDSQWLELADRYKPGTVVTGRVVNIASFGVFVSLDGLPDITALLEIIEFENGSDRPLRFPEDYPSIGSRVTAYIAFWNREVRAVRITQRKSIARLYGVYIE